jgi:hypothetical protein
MTFDIAEHADAIAEMRAVQDELDAESRPLREAIAEATALVGLVDKVRRERLDALGKAKLDLAGALETVMHARAALEEATELQLQALEALSILRGGDHHIIRRHVLAAELAA